MRSVVSLTWKASQSKDGIRSCKTLWSQAWLLVPIITQRRWLIPLSSTLQLCFQERGVLLKDGSMREHVLRLMSWEANTTRKCSKLLTQRCYQHGSEANANFPLSRPKNMLFGINTNLLTDLVFQEIRLVWNISLQVSCLLQQCSFNIKTLK